MQPILLDLDFIQIRSYGLLLAISFFVGILLGGRRAKERGIAPQIVMDLGVLIIIASIVGARLLYVVFHLDQYTNPLQLFAIWEGGATFYGGFIGAILASYFYVQHKKVSFFRMFDVLVPSIALGLFISRFGCFLSGCCFGKPTDLPWGVHFPHDSPAGVAAAEYAARHGLVDVALHPAQVYSALYGLIIFVTLMLVDNRLKERRGALTGLFLIMYGVARFSIDFVRLYEDNALWGGLTFNQYISIGMLLLGAYFMRRKSNVAT